MFSAVIILTIIVAILLILIVLIQNSKGGGLSSQFGGSGASQVIGVKKTTDLLEKITWGFAIAVMVLSLTSSLLIDNGSGLPSNANIDRAREQQLNTPVAPLPADTTGTNSLEGLTPAEDTTSNQD